MRKYESELKYFRLKPFKVCVFILGTRKRVIQTVFFKLIKIIGGISIKIGSISDKSDRG